MTNTIDPARIAALSQEARVLFYRYLLEAGERPGISLGVQEGEPFNLLASQRPLALLADRDEDAAFNRVSVTLSIEGALDLHAIKQALQDVAERHSAVRLRFSGRPANRQWVESKLDDSALTFVDFSRHPNPDVASRQARLRFEREPMAPSDGPLFRVQVIRLSDSRHHLGLCGHHLVLDTWALDVLAIDLGAAYRARMGGRAPEWLAPAPRIADLARFEAELALARGGQTLQAGEAVPDLTPPPEFARSVRHTTVGLLSRSLGALRDAGGMPAWFATAVMRTLSRMSGETHGAVALACANRMHPDVQGLVAPLVTARRLEADFDPARSPAEVEAAIAESMRKLAAGEGATADTQAVLIVIQNAVSTGLQLPGTRIERIETMSGASHYDLTFVLHIGDEGLTMDIEYRSDLYSDAFISGLADHVCARLDGREPPVADVLEAEGDGETEAGDDPIKRFIAHARAAPTEPALLVAEAGVSREDLLTALEGALLALEQHDPEQRPVVILAEGAPAALAMAACWRAERCFCVLPPGAGSSLLQARARQLGAGLVVSGDPANGTLGLSWRALPGDARAPSALGRDIAYVAFTSGSTMAPKAIVQSRRAFSQFIAWQDRTFAFGVGTRVAMWSAPVFDACYTEVFGALANGSTLCIPQSTERLEPRATAAWLAHHEVEYFLTVPSFLTRVVNYWRQNGPPSVSLRTVAVSGEKLSADLVERFFDATSNVRLFNLFGPTECILATFNQIGADHPPGLTPAVGGPIEGRRLHLRDQAGYPVTALEAGELWIESDFLTEGYLGDRQATERAYPSIEGRRAFRTGDLCRINPRGALEFLRRVGDVEKIAGARVELNVVEAALRKLPDVREAAVVVRQEQGRSQLAGFILTEDKRHTYGRAIVGEARAALVAELAKHLDPVAIPSVLIAMETLPRTATGKLDRRSLAGFQPNFEPSHPPFDGDKAVLAERVTGAWHEVLGFEPGPQINFFDAGGGSLAAVDLAGALDKRFPGQVTLQTIYQMPTISDQVAFLFKATDAEPAPSQSGRRSSRLCRRRENRRTSIKNG